MSAIISVQETKNETTNPMKGEMTMNKADEQNIGTEELAKNGKLPLHPYCSLFPVASEAEITAMAESIIQDGLRERITLYKGQILDGRNRYNACKKTGVSFEPFDQYFVEYKGDTSDDCLLQFVMLKNSYRRHLMTSQRALIAAKMSREQKGRKRNDEKDNPQICGFTQVKAAELLVAKLRLVEAAAKLLRDGTPELIAKVESGEITVHAALKKSKPSEPKTPKPNAPAVKTRKSNKSEHIEEDLQDTQEQDDVPPTGGTGDAFLELAEPPSTVSDDNGVPDNNAPFTFDNDKEPEKSVEGSEVQAQSYVEKFSEDIANFKLTIKRRSNDLSQEEGLMVYREFRKLTEWLRKEHEDVKKKYATRLKH